MPSLWLSLPKSISYVAAALLAALRPLRALLLTPGENACGESEHKRQARAHRLQEAQGDKTKRGGVMVVGRKCKMQDESLQTLRH
jgi:hypothetical protein